MACLSPAFTHWHSGAETARQHATLTPLTLDLDTDLLAAIVRGAAAPEDSATYTALGREAGGVSISDVYRFNLYEQSLTEIVAAIGAPISRRCLHDCVPLLLTSS